jgi:hypothetical protein
MWIMPETNLSISGEASLTVLAVLTMVTATVTCWLPSGFGLVVVHRCSSLRFAHGLIWYGWPGWQQNGRVVELS